MQKVSPWLFGLCLVCIAWALDAQGEMTITYQLSRIDEGVGWVSSYWGYNAPKLVYDGEAFYTVALWGAEQATSTGALYQYKEGEWRKGYTWDGLNYQPGMLLLDSQRRLVLIYSRAGEAPVVLRARTGGDFEQFDSIPVPTEIGKAGYLGAGIYDDRIVLGYIGDPQTYSFNIAVLDLRTGEWSGPHLLARAQREQEPWTTWLYPIILPDEDGFHLVLSNNADLSSYYDRILYMYLPYDGMAEPRPEEVARVDPWTANIAFAENAWRAADGSLYVTGQYKPEGESNQLYVYRRDARTRQWSDQFIGAPGVGAVFESARQPGRLWLTSTHGSRLRLHTSVDRGDHWESVELPDFSAPGLVSSYFLHGISPASGSAMPEVPTAVFSAGAHPHYQLWFVQFDTPSTATAVLGEQMIAEPSPEVRLHQNSPNGFNAETAIRFALPASGTVELTVFNLAGQKVATLVKGVRNAGTNAVRWDGRDDSGRALASGVYLYRLKVDERQVETRKLLLTR